MVLQRSENNGIEKTITETLDFGEKEGEIHKKASDSFSGKTSEYGRGTMRGIYGRLRKVLQDTKTIGFSLVRSLINNSI